MVKTIKGIAASDGIATAEAYLLVQPDLSFTKKSISDADAEISRLKDAISTSDDELTKSEIPLRNL
ncbi:phosphoenolpyruvate-protein phosphotransferase [Companilactobacillus farciminis]|nr:phosphoenolpyruvate-protein phosphotransferase [Companilactobacillus farciminis]